VASPDRFANQYAARFRTAAIFRQRDTFDVCAGHGVDSESHGCFPNFLSSFGAVQFQEMKNAAEAAALCLVGRAKKLPLLLTVG
jgi:hypothetical protein